MVTCMICSFYLWHYSPAYLGISFIQDLHSIFFFSTCGHPCHPGFSVDSSGGTDSCSGHYAYLTTSHLDEVWQSNVSDSHVAARLAYQGCLESQILVSFFTNVLVASSRVLQLEPVSFSTSYYHPCHEEDNKTSYYLLSIPLHSFSAYRFSSCTSQQSATDVSQVAPFQTHWR